MIRIFLVILPGGSYCGLLQSGISVLRGRVELHALIWSPRESYFTILYIDFWILFILIYEHRNVQLNIIQFKIFHWWNRGVELILLTLINPPWNTNRFLLLPNNVLLCVNHPYFILLLLLFLIRAQKRWVLIIFFTFQIYKSLRRLGFQILVLVRIINPRWVYTRVVFNSTCLTIKRWLKLLLLRFILRVPNVDRPPSLKIEVLIFAV